MAGFVPCSPPDSVLVRNEPGLNPVSYFNFSSPPVVDASRVTVTIFPACSSPAELDLMCPRLLSNGRPCTDNATCVLNPGTCVVGGSGRASCTYRLDLIKDMQDLSFLLRSTSRDNQGRFPIPTAGLLAENFADRLMSLDKSAKVTPHMKAEVTQVASRNKALRRFVNEKNWGDYRTLSEVPAWGGPATDWGPIYWQQARWLAAIMTKDSAMPSAGGQGNLCYVSPNYIAEETRVMRQLFDQAQL